MVDDAPQSEEPRHAIAVVTHRTGLTAEAVRAWEKRHGAVAPGRSSGGQRLFSDRDIQRLQLLARLTDAGHRIGRIASLDDQELRRLLETDAAAVASRTPSSESVAQPARWDHLGDCLGAVSRLDGTALRATLQRASVALGGVALLDEVIVPLLHEIGRRWGAGTLQPAHEHLASSLVASLLANLRAATERAEGPRLVVSTPIGEHHELGALLAALTAARDGWTVTHLGPDLPANDIAAAASHSGARAVALSFVHPVDEVAARDDALRLASTLPANVPLLVGGQGSRRHARKLSAAGVRVLDSLAELSAELGALG